MFRSHAYEVSPDRLSATPRAPRGGSFAADSTFKTSMLDFATKAKLDSQPLIDFSVTPTSNGQPPTHPVRGNIMSYLFGTAQAASAAAFSLAKRLGTSMDNRSPYTLMLLTAYNAGATKRLIIWSFPKDEPFQFSASGTRARIRIVEDAFSRSSSFKKAAMYVGENRDNHFWQGRVIDKQSDNGFRTAADYWIAAFLDARYSLSGDAGTQLLADRLRTEYQSATSQSAKDQLSNAVVAINASQRQQWTIQRVANDFLSGSTKQDFIDRTPSELRTASFRINKDLFWQKLSFRVFRLEDDVIVSAPFGTVGHSVQIKDGPVRTLSYSGTIVDEKLRAKHA